jgi:hypothetical protein
MAGLSYIYAVGRHFRAKCLSAGGDQPSTPLDEDPSIMGIVNDTRACSNVLVAVSERWSAPPRCHVVFDRLSDAVLADAIEHSRRSAEPIVISFRVTRHLALSTALSQSLPDPGAKP